MPNLVNDFEVRKETLRALGGNPDGLANIYEVDLEILKLIGEGGGGIDWDTIKQKLANDGVESIKFTMGSEEIILTADEVKTLLNQPIIPEGKYMTMTVDESNSGETIISPTVTGTLPNLNLQYRINNGDWNDFIVGTTADIHVVAGDFVQFKGVNESGLSIDYDNYLNFSISDLCHLSGNVMSLIDGVGDSLEIPNRLCFYKLFENSNVKTVSSDFLPATNLQSECYRSLFSYCSNLTKAPSLPSTELETYCYIDMFRGCGALTTAPELPAKVLLDSCYTMMFESCTSLNYVKCNATNITANDALYYWLSGVAQTGTFVKPAGVTYPSGAGGIPEGWTVKEFDEYIEAPKDGKQYARQNGEWTPVESVEPGIPDAPSDGQQYARQNGEWTPVQIPTVEKYMTITADESNTGETIIHPNIEGSLPNLNLQYRINNGKWTDFIVGTTADIKIGAGDVLQFKGDNKEGVSKNDTSGYNCLNFAISGNPVALSGNIMSLIDGVGDALEIPNDYCFCSLFRNSAAIKTVSSDFLPATTLTSSCYRDLFSGCQNLTQAPELPATTLIDGCYHGMFYNCASLTTAPELPAKTLVGSCYGYMFTYCNALNYVKCLATEGTVNGDGTVPSALDNWLEGVASTGTFEKLSGVSYEAGNNGIPEGWTVKEIYDYVEAPMDGKQYARQDGAWAVVEKGILDAPIDGVQYARKNCNWTPVEKGIDWNTIKQKLAEDGVESIKFIIGNEQVILTASEVKTLINQTVIPDAPSDGKQYARQDGAWVESEPNKVKTTKDTTLKFWDGTQQEYDAIATKDANTLYIIK